MKRPFFTVATFAKINTRRFFRDKTAIFFSIGFPLIFLFVFGNLYGNNSNVSFNIAVINKSDSAFAKDFAKSISDNKILKTKTDITTIESAKDKMSRAELDAAIVLPSDFGSFKGTDRFPSGQVEIVYTQNNQQSATALGNVLESQFKQINGRFVDTVTPFTVVSKQLNEKSLSSFDYAFAGLLGFAIIGIGILGPINVFPELKKMGILRRLSTTPIRVWQYFLSTMVGQVAIGLISLTLMFIIAITVFHLNVIGNWFELVIFLMLSIVMILGIGLALGGWAKNERQVAPLANMIVFPMMFLSGTFFPRFLMPDWVQTVSSLLPLTPVIDGIRLIANEGKHFIDILPQIGLIGLWMVFIYLVAFKVFRWE